MHKYTHGQMFRDAPITAGQQEHRAQTWLSDDRLNPILKPEDNE
jgi:hypothetical protein